MADQNFHSIIPKFPIGRKISGFSLKEIDRSLLLEDFLRKSKIVDSGDFFIHGENLGTFYSGSGPSYDFFHFLIFSSSSCVLSIPHGLHTPKIFLRRQFNVKVRYISNFLLILANFDDL